MRILKRFLEKVKNSPGSFWQYVKKRPVRSVFALLLAILLLSVVSFVGYIFHYVFYDRRNLPDIQALVNFDPPTIGTIYDENGKTVINLAKEFRWISKPEEIPEVVRQAVLSAEDKNFYEKNGVDWTAFFFRAGIRNLVHVAENIYHHKKPIIEAQQGASTLDQQLVRLFFLQELVRHEGSDPVNKFWRKFEEWRLAIWINEELKKPEYFGSKQKAKEHILACLLSYAYFKGVYGIKAASLFYFNKDVKDLGYEEAALLAGIMKNPLLYAPSSKKPLKTTGLSYQRQLNRRNGVLSLMVDNKYLTKEAADKLKETDIPIPNSKNINIQTDAPSVIRDVFTEVKDNNIDVERIFDGEVQVYTTVNLEIQKIANQALENGLKAYEERYPESKGVIQGSVVVLRNKDGAVLAEVGGRQVYRSKPITYTDYHRAKYALRQPGSAFKPFVYLTAFMNGWTLKSTVMDRPISVPMGSIKIDGKWIKRPPKWIGNYDGKSKGPISARDALKESRNQATMWLTKQLADGKESGIEKVVDTAHLLGVKSLLHNPNERPYITTAIGATEVTLLELANAYRAMASGIYAEPFTIVKLTDRNGEVIYRAKDKTKALDIDETALERIQEGMRGVIRIPGGTAHALDNKDFPIPVMAKTGTTNDFRDARFGGSTFGMNGITVAVWIGYDDFRELGPKETGGRTALPIFKEIMLNIYDRNLAGPVPQFPEEIEKNIDNYLHNPQ